MKRLMIYTRYKKPNPAKYAAVLKENSNYILMFSLFVCGLIIGTSVSFLLKAELNFVNQTLNNVIYNYSNFQYFISSLSFSLVFIIICICSGLSCMGYPFICILMVLRGVLNGIIAGYLLITTGIKGLVLFLLIIIPGETIFVSAFIVLCGFCGKLAGKLAAIAFLGNKEEILFRENGIKITILALISLLSVLINLISRMLFLNLF